MHGSRGGSGCRRSAIVDAGDVDMARASLERYLAQYPETRLPRDLQPLLAD